MEGETKKEMSLFSKKYLARYLTIAVLLLFVWYAINNRTTLEGLSSVGALALGLVVMGRLAVFVNNAYFIKWTTEAFTKKIPTGEGLYIGILSAIGNFFGPILGGAGVRAVYLKKVYGLSFSKFSATLFSYYIILFSVVCLSAILGLIFLEEINNILLPFFVGWLLIMAGVILKKMPGEKFLKRRFKKGLIATAINVLFDIENGWRILIRNKDLTKKLVFLAVLSFVTQLFISFIEFRAIGVSLSMAALVLYTSLVVVSLLISFTPGAIGIREAILLVFGSVMGVTNEQIIQVAVIDRGATFGLLFVLFILSRSRNVKKTLTSKELPI